MARLVAPIALRRRITDREHPDRALWRPLGEGGDRVGAGEGDGRDAGQVDQRIGGGADFEQRLDHRLEAQLAYPVGGGGGAGLGAGDPYHPWPRPRRALALRAARHADQP